MTAAELTRNLVASLVVIVVFALGYLLAARAGQRFVKRIAHQGEPGTRAATLWSMVRRLLLVAVVVTTALTVMGTVWNVPIAPFLAVGSAVGVALGFGAQKLVQDVIAGFFLLVEDQFRIGDVVSISGVNGEVQELRLRVTVLRDNAGSVHYVPNGEIRVATNMTQGYAQVVIDLAIAYENDLDRALAVLQDELNALSTDERWLPSFLDRPQVLGVERLGETSVVVRALARVRPADRWSVHREALRRIKRRFQEEGLSLPGMPLAFYRRDEGGTTT
ncbi:MAG TPA: mechanosensitive ion channel family protein [Acidimicrobiia bacterium]|nr:mechanosensitive ion channel family protein [Acidimicrobiia bacterium]